MNGYFLIGLLLAINLPSFAQSAKLRKANEAFEQLAFAEAIDLYKDVLAREENQEAIVRLADCYRMINDPVSAETWYARAVKFDGIEPINYLYYAQALQENEKYNEARTWFEKYSKARPDDPRGSWGVEACESVEDIKNKDNHWWVIHLPVNSENSDFGPAFYHNGIVFASDRVSGKKTKAVFKWTGTPFLNVYATSKQGADWSEPDLLTGSANSIYHDGPVTFTGDYKTMFLTRNHYDPNAVGGKVSKSDENIVKLKIIVETFDPSSGSWSKAEELPFNNPEYSVAHPALTPDGKTLIFSSDMPGGFGGTDLWYSVLENGQWKDPVNLGKDINTPGDEMFPFIGQDSTLYFASDAWPGLGGLDIFMAAYNREEKKFEKPENLGAPINSSRDDFALILDSRTKSGYFTSNRKGGTGNDDIYSFEYNLVNLIVQVVDKETGEPLPRANLDVLSGDKPLAHDQVDENGEFFMVIPRNADFSAEGSKPGYLANLVPFDSREVTGNDTVRVRVPLERVSIMLEGVVYNKQTNEPIGEALVRLTDKTTGTMDSLVTGPDGFFTWPLNPDHEYYLTGLKPNFVYDELTFDTRGIQKSETIHKDLYLEPIEVGVPIVLENIYYDFDRANIREDASKDLQKVLRILQENPGYKVEISSHTDSRGSFIYNERLSQKRAQAVVNWLVDHGIDKKRLIAKGYGEYKLRNHCADGVECTEYEHQRNRRTEFTLLSDEGTVVAQGDERYNDPNKKDEYVPGGEYTGRERVNGNLVPGQPSLEIDKSDEPEVVDPIPVIRPKSNRSGKPNKKGEKPE